MKKIVIAFLLISMSLAAYANPGKDPKMAKERLMSLIGEYAYKDGFEVVRLGTLGTSILKGTIKIAASCDEDGRMISDAIKDIRRIAVVEYEDSDNRTKEEFESRLERILESSELLMETKEEDKAMRIYGIIDEEGSSLKDFVMYTPGDCALICLFGSIPIETLAKIAE